MQADCIPPQTDLGSRVSSPTLTKKKKNNKNLKKRWKFCWKCFSGAPPSHKPQQLSSTAPRNVQEGQRHDRRRGEKRSEVWVATGSTNADAGLRLLRASKSTSIYGQSGRAPLQLGSVPLWFASQFGIYQKLGQPSCLSVRSGYFSRTFGEFGGEGGWRGGGQDSIAYSNLEPLILFC